MYWLIDFAHEELSIAGLLSGDGNLIAACQAPDPYTDFAIRAGLAPPEATKFTHAELRDSCKVCLLGTLYGMKANRLAKQIKRPRYVAEQLLAAHHQVYRRFWKWSDALVLTSCGARHVDSLLGWRLNVTATTREGRLRNFAVQACGAELLRLATCLLVEGGVKVSGLVHDAVLISIPARELYETTWAAEELMAKAVVQLFNQESAMKLIPTETVLVAYPDHFPVGRGERVWKVVKRLMRTSVYEREGYADLRPA